MKKTVSKIKIHWLRAMEEWKDKKVNEFKNVSIEIIQSEKQDNKAENMNRAQEPLDHPRHWSSTRRSKRG